MTDDFQYYELNSLSHGALNNIMGTKIDVVIYDIDKNLAVDNWKHIKTELEYLDKMMNRFDSESEISKINQHAFNEPVAISKELWFVLHKCYEYYEKTLGFFDITLSDFSKVILCEHNYSVAFISPKIKLDLGAYAKGYALQKIQEQLKHKNIHNAFISFGNSSILGIGHHPYGDSWKVSIENPYKHNDIFGEISIKDSSLSTSGNTPGYSNHIVNPKTGIKNNERKLVCVLAKEPVEAEVLSTTLTIANKEERVEIIRNFEVEDIKIFKST